MIMSMPPSRAVRLGALLLIVLAMLGWSAAPADAAPSLTVSKTSGLDPDGETVTVSGQGYDEAKGIYVGLCVDNGPGQAPAPCIGGMDMEGDGGSSAWISSNPPDYGEGLAVPYGSGGSFQIRIHVQQADQFTDCAEVACAVVTRNDHTRSSDRSQDVRIPVSFAAPAAPATEEPSPEPTGDTSPAPSPTPSSSPSRSAPASEAPDDASTPASAPDEGADDDQPASEPSATPEETTMPEATAEESPDDEPSDAATIPTDDETTPEPEPDTLADDTVALPEPKRGGRSGAAIVAGVLGVAALVAGGWWWQRRSTAS